MSLLVLFLVLVTPTGLARVEQRYGKLLAPPRPPLAILKSFSELATFIRFVFNKLHLNLPVDLCVYLNVANKVIVVTIHTRAFSSVW